MVKYLRIRGSNVTWPPDSHVETSEGMQEVDECRCQRDDFVCFPEACFKYARTEIVRDNRRIVAVGHPSEEVERIGRQ
jgi:hypothetical protein